jgi:hypothetical protein
MREAKLRQKAVHRMVRGRCVRDAEVGDRIYQSPRSRQQLGGGKGSSQICGVALLRGFRPVGVGRNRPTAVIRVAAMAAAALKTSAVTHAGHRTVIGLSSHPVQNNGLCQVDRATWLGVGSASTEGNGILWSAAGGNSFYRGTLPATPAFPPSISSPTRLRSTISLLQRASSC